MTSNDILKSDLLDILFDNRNKQYGAYTLRKHYNNRLLLSLGIALSSALLLFLFFGGTKTSEGAGPSRGLDDVVIQTVKLPEETPKLPEIPKQKPMTAQPVQQLKYTNFVIKPDDVVKITPPDQTSLLNSLIGKQNIDGRTATRIDIPVVNDPVDHGSGNGEQKTNTFIPEEREPEFPGGEAAWLNFLRKNLSAPDELEAGEKKSVMVRFLVSVDGAVTGFEIVQSAGRSFDNEVVRVLKKMPKWKPAIQNGVAVVKYYTQPVTFIGVEQ